MTLRRRECQRFPGLLLEQRGDTDYTFIYGAVFESYRIDGGHVIQVDCSDKGVWPTRISRYVAAWLLERAKEKVAVSPATESDAKAS